MTSSDPARIIIDTDPGVDDAIAILMLLADHTLEIVGITTVGGNVPLPDATRNALALLEYAGRTDIPVYRGAGRPTSGDFPYARHVHTETGLTVTLPRPTTSVFPTPATPFLAHTLLNNPGAVTLIALGPLTNLAWLVRQYPGALAAAKRIVVMGGAVDTHGNSTPYAEFNFFSDPSAARIVLEHGAELTLVDLAACREVFVSREQAAMNQSDNRLGALAAELVANWFALDTSRLRFNLYDPLAALAVTRPETLQLEQCTMTVVDSMSTDDPSLWGKCEVLDENGGPISIARPTSVDRQAAHATLRDLLGWR